MSEHSSVGVLPRECKNKMMPYFIFVLASCFYLYEFILQVSPSVMTEGIMVDFQVGAAGLGFVSAAYFYAYTPMQIPAGLLYDRFGPRVLLSFALSICILGAFLFSMTDTTLIAALGRFLMGTGSAFSFIGTLILASRWFPARQYAMLVGIAQALSSVGAIMGETPLAHAVARWGWRSTLFGIACAGIVLLYFMARYIRDYPQGAEPKPSTVKRESEWSRLSTVLANFQSWSIAFYAFSVWAPIIIFAGLWGVPYLTLRFGLSTTDSASLMALVWIGIGIGSPLFGWWSDRIYSRRLPILICSLIGLVSTILLLYAQLSVTAVAVALFFLGIAASGQSVSFAIVKDNNSPQHVGTASGFNNMATVAGGLFLQPLIGLLLHLFWSGEMSGSIPVYSIASYQKALVVLPICFLVASLLAAFFIRETKCQPAYKE